MNDCKIDAQKLSAAFGALRSRDVLTQKEGVTAAIQMGSGAVPRLLDMLDEPLENRGPVMYALAQIGDPQAQQAFAAGVEDSDANVRAYAARGLTRIGDPAAMAASLRTLNDGADELHLDMTPSVQSLGGMGLKVVPSLLDLLLEEDEMTRLHAQRALELILSRRQGFVAGKGFPSSAAEAEMRSEWAANGNYDYSNDTDSRAASVAKWHLWLAEAKE